MVSNNFRRIALAQGLLREPPAPPRAATEPPVAPPQDTRTDAVRDDEDAD